MPYDINQMYIHDSPENLIEIKKFYLTLEKTPEYLFLLNEWQQYVRDEMDKHLFSKITYNPCKKNRCILILLYYCHFNFLMNLLKSKSLDILTIRQEQI
jgi:hypothetical protein